MEVEFITIPTMCPFPNNPELPLRIYRTAVGPDSCSPEWFEDLFTRNGWSGLWRNGVYSFHHFHSTTHEVLGCYSGWADVMFGGPSGINARLCAGDAVLIPAGVGHCLTSFSSGFHVVGAYPHGFQPDLKKGNEAQFQYLLRTVGEVPVQFPDPLTGT